MSPAEAAMKIKLATASLGGCFGCHMSLLDIDERILDLAQLVDFDRSPIDDIKHISQRCTVGLISDVGLAARLVRLAVERFECTGRVECGQGVFQHPS